MGYLGVTLCGRMARVQDAHCHAEGDSGRRIVTTMTQANAESDASHHAMVTPPPPPERPPTPGKPPKLARKPWPLRR